MKEIEVFFNNGNRGKVSPDKAVLCDKAPSIGILLQMQEHGMTIINWNHVCMMRLHEKKEDDE